MKCLRLLGAGLLIAAAGLGVAPGPAAAASPELPARAWVAAEAAACPASDASGVTVVVDFAGLGGGTVVRCATGLTKASRGSAALAAAGISWTSVSGQGGFACRIAGRPAADETISSGGGSSYHEACVDTPPADAYWSYWQSTGDGSWTYSSAGLTASRVKLGGFEGWAFSSKTRAPPRVKPLAAPVVAPPATTTAVPPPAKTTTTPAPPPAKTTTSTQLPQISTQPPPKTTTSPTRSSVPTTTSTTPASVELTAAPPVSSDSPSAPPAAESAGATSSSVVATTLTADNTAESGAFGVGSGAAAAPGSGPAGAMLATVGGVALVGGVAAAAVVISRRRRLGD